MPTYEYGCKSCGHSFEVIQSMRDDPLKVCPQCGKEIRRLISRGGGIIFKGSGFYVTDNSKKSSGSSSQPPAKPAEPACAGCAKAESGGCAGSSAASGAQAVNS